jgi:hypothetical protein
LRALDDLLASHGYPRISPWWWRELERFYRSPRRRLVVRKGRRVGASTIVAPRLAVAEMLWGEHVHTPGAPPLAFVFLSVRRDEASNRLRGVRAILDILSERYIERGETIELESRPALFTVVTASFRTAVGDTVAFAWADEVARWNDGDSNPASEVVGALAPALATLPDARLFLVSSPLGKRDFHARQVSLGDTEAQNVAVGSTWEINPILTEADTRALEPHESTWRREYGAIPSDSDFESFIGEHALASSIDAGRAAPEPVIPGAAYTIAVDAAFTENGDRFGGAVVTHRLGDWIEAERRRGPAVCRVQETFAWRADREPREMARRLKREVCDRYGVDTVVADQHESRSWKQLASDIGLNVKIVPWTASQDDGGKTQRFKLVRSEMIGGRLRLPDDPSLADEFRSVYSEIRPSGYEAIVIPRNSSGHGDRVSAIVMAASIALAGNPELPPHVWTHEEYLERKAQWFNGMGYWIGGCASRVFAADWDDRTAAGRCLSYPEMRRRIANGTL